MRARARRIELHGDAGVDDFPAAAEIGGVLGERRVLAVHRCQKSLRPFDRRRARGHAAARQLRREHAVARRESGVQRLHHRAEVLFQAGRFRRRDRQRVAARRFVQTEQPRRRRGGADRAERRRAVPAALIVPRVHRASQPRLDLEADDVRVEQRAARGAGDFGRGERRRDQRRARMRERDEAHVVVVERVRGGAVGQRRIAGAGAGGEAQDRARALAV